MPVRDRRRSVGQSIWCFLRQDYEQRELIVVDDGDGEVADDVPDDPRIRYVRCSERVSAAARRAAGCRTASGELIAHWDAGVWYGPRRLSAQVERLTRSGAGATAFAHVLHFQPLTGRVWRHVGEPPRHEPSTLLFRRERQREDIRTVDAGDGSEHAVSVLEGSRTAPVNAADPSWQPRPFAELRRVLDLDLPVYAARRDAGVARPRRTAPLPIMLAATFMVYDGYGSMAEYLALGLARAGADVQVLPLRMDAAGISDELRQMIADAHPDPTGVVLCHAWWGENLARFGGAGDLFVKTAWESSRLPADWPARLDRARAVIVPSRWAARVFRDSGVTVPVEVAHEGIDPAVYPYVERPARPGPTTLVVGVLAARKNFRAAVAAWKLAFADDPDARLILKARFQLERYEPDDPRVRVCDSNEPTRGILHWYREADILLALGNEGFGLPLIEGMATGLPAVALDSEAQGDVCREAPDCLLPVPAASWADVEDPAFGRCGVRALPDIPAAAAALRWVADHPTEARELGRRASEWAHAQRNVWDLGPQTLAAIERHARTERPLRRARAVWAPLTGAPAGYRIYAEGLVRCLAHTRLRESAPRAWRAQVLHVQHLPGLFDEVALARAVQDAGRQGAAVVVTEHAVGATARAWEGRADALVALDEESAAQLRTRWPGKRVEVIPPGSPVWREPSRAPGPATIAVLGAAEPATAAALSALRGVRLLAVGAAAASTLAAPGYALPRSGDVLAGLLNRAADAVLVLGAGAAAEHCARAALASGVAVAMPQASAALAASGATLRAADVERLLDGSVRAALLERARAHCETWSWQSVAALHHALWQALEA